MDPRNIQTKRLATISLIFGFIALAQICLQIFTITILALVGERFSGFISASAVATLLPVLGIIYLFSPVIALVCGYIAYQRTTSIPELKTSRRSALIGTVIGAITSLFFVCPAITTLL